MNQDIQPKLIERTATFHKWFKKRKEDYILKGFLNERLARYSKDGYKLNYKSLSFPLEEFKFTTETRVYYKEQISKTHLTFIDASDSKKTQNKDIENTLKIARLNLQDKSIKTLYGIKKFNMSDYDNVTNGELQKMQEEEYEYTNSFLEICNKILEVKCLDSVNENTSIEDLQKILAETDYSDPAIKEALGIEPFNINDYFELGLLATQGYLMKVFNTDIPANTDVLLQVIKDSKQEFKELKIEDKIPKGLKFADLLFYARISTLIDKKSREIEFKNDFESVKYLVI